MSSTANKSLRILDGNMLQFPVAANSRIYQGSLVGQNASNGFARAYTAGDRPLGFAIFNEANNNPGAAGAMQVDVLVRGMISLPITSVAITDEGQPVWATDDDSFTLTNTADALAIGHVVRLDPNRSGHAWVAFDFFQRMEPAAKLTAATTDTTVLQNTVNAIITAIERQGIVLSN